MDPATVSAMIAGLALAFKLLDMADRALHTFGINKVIATQFRHLAAMPGNKLAPIEEKIADVVDSGKDLDAIKTAEKIADGAKGAQSIGAVAAVVGSEVMPDVFKG